MPQLEIEYTANLTDLDARKVLDAAVAALAGLGEFDMASTKARIRRVDEFSVDHPDSGGAFVAVSLGVLPGRSTELRERISRTLTDAVAAAVPARDGTQVTTELRELTGYTKTTL